MILKTDSVLRLYDMHKTTCFFIIITLALTNIQTFTQEINIPDKFHIYTTQDGLSSPLVRSIIQDKYGYIWIGTEDGLNKFDGYNFKTYGYDVTNPNSLPDNIITCLSTSADGGIYAGTLNGGFAKYNPDKDNFKVYSAIYGQSGALQHNSIGPVFEDSEGNLWIGSMGGSLYFKGADVDTFKLLNHNPADPSTLGNNIVVGIVEDSEGNIWVRTNAGLSKIDNKNNSITNFTISRPIIEFHLRYTENTLIDKDDIIWMGWNSEIIKFNTKNAEIEYLTPTNLTRNFGFISSVCEHDNNHLWLGSWAAIYLYDKNLNTVKPYYHDPLRLESIPLANNEAIFKDNTGVLWCSGLAKLNLVNKNIQHITTQSTGMTVQDNYIRSIFVDNKGKYWISTNLGIDIIDPYSKTTENYQINPADSTYFLNSFTSVFGEDSQGNIWIAQWGQGLVVLRNGDPHNFYRIKNRPGVENALQNGNIQAILQDANGFMWFGLDNGVCVMDVNTLQARTFINDYTNPNTPTPFSVEPKSIAEDENGHVWIGTWGGLTQAKILNPELGIMNSEFQFKQYYNVPGNLNTISDNRTVSLLCDAEQYPGVVFAGSYGGGINAIYLSSSGEYDSISYITKNEGLPNNTIFGMLTDKEGYIWASTNLGLCQFNPNKNEYHIYDKNDGFQDNNFLRSAWAKDEGNLLFGGANGFNIFDPLNLGEDETPPMLVFTGLELDGKIVEIGKKVNKRIILKHNINEIKKLVLTHKEKTVTITFSALHYAFPKNNKYKYMLEGFDKNWLTVDANVRRVSYSNLKPGNYVLKVLASNYDDIPMKAPRELKIKVRTPWWRTIIFYILLVVFIAIGILYFIQKREEQARKDKAKLQKRIDEGEAVIAEKMQEVEKQKAEIKERDEQEKEIRYFTDGIARFSDILAKNSENIEQLSQHIISELVSYVGGCLGGIYLLNDQNEEDKFLELKGAFATDTSMINNKKFNVGEGYIGTCFNEVKTIVLNDVPEGYTQLSSGLGNGKPEQFYFIPLLQNDIIEGVIEIASFNHLDKYKVEFIEKIAENITSNITVQKAKSEADKLLQQSKIQASQLHEQEEEMRQNLEELQATQEESQRREDTNNKLIEALKIESNLFKSLLNQFPDNIYFKDINSKYISVSKSLLTRFKIESEEEIIGKTDSEFFKEKQANDFFNDELNIIKTGKGIIDKIVKEQYLHGGEQWVYTTKLPLLNEEGKCTGILGISGEVSRIERIETLIKQNREPK